MNKAIKKLWKYYEQLFQLTEENVKWPIIHSIKNSMEETDWMYESKMYNKEVWENENTIAGNIVILIECCMTLNAFWPNMMNHQDRIELSDAGYGNDPGKRPGGELKKTTLATAL